MHLLFSECIPGPEHGQVHYTALPKQLLVQRVDHMPLQQAHVLRQNQHTWVLKGHVRRAVECGVTCMLSYEVTHSETSNRLKHSKIGCMPKNFQWTVAAVLRKPADMAVCLQRCACACSAHTRHLQMSTEQLRLPPATQVVCVPYRLSSYIQLLRSLRPCCCVLN